jgi:hypothetical protein
MIDADTVSTEEPMSTESAHQETREFVRVLRERNREAIERATRRQAEINEASRRSAGVVEAARRRLRASGVIR